MNTFILISSLFALLSNVLHSCFLIYFPIHKIVSFSHENPSFTCYLVYSFINLSNYNNRMIQIFIYCRRPVSIFQILKIVKVLNHSISTSHLNLSLGKYWYFLQILKFQQNSIYTFLLLKINNKIYWNNSEPQLGSTSLRLNRELVQRTHNNTNRIMT